MNRWRRRALGAGVALGVLAWIAIPVTIFTAATIRVAEVPLRESELMWVAPEEAGPAVESSLGIAVEWGADPSLRAPAWEGLVQRVDVQPGQEITHGTSIGLVSGIVRQAWRTDVPISRALAAQDSGPEVAAMKAAFRELGMRVTEGDRVDWLTLQTIRAFAETIGVESPETVLAFEPAWVVFLPRSIAVGEILLDVGGAAPTMGTEIIHGGEKVQRGIFTSVSVLDQLIDSEAPVDIERDVPPNDRIAVAADAAISIGDVGISPDSEVNTEVGRDSLDDLTALLRPQSAGTTALQATAAPRDSWILPVAAVALDSEGHACILIRRGDATQGFEFEVLSEIEGSVVGTATIEIGDKVALYPSEGIQCGSP